MKLRTEKVLAPRPRVAIVFAVSDVSKGRRLIRKGDVVNRDNVMVVERPDLFEVRIPLEQYEEVNDGNPEPGQ